MNTHRNTFLWWVLLCSPLLLSPPKAHTPFTLALSDDSCDLEAIGRANQVQLHSILQELLNTTYFRLFRVNLQSECTFWQNKNDNAVESPPPQHDSHAQTDHHPPTELCTGPKITDMFSEAPIPACAITTDSSTSPSPLPFVTHKVDRTISQPEANAVTSVDCELPEFWLDICTNINTHANDYVNLQRNPERWTGYNGSRVWQAIYHENCFAGGTNSLDRLCYEERVLYRLLSGMHASINTHISLAYFPPAKGKRSDWEPNPEAFMKSLGSHPDRIKNLHFAYGVLLRSLHKASPLLKHYPFSTNSANEDKHTQQLFIRLLESPILSSCERAFSGFDETLLFAPNGSPSTIASLKQNFKGVFQNISSLLDCVTCQKCRLHGKLYMLGVGTALKILLLPENLLRTSLNREEVVALINTLGKFSHAIHQIPLLTALYEQQQQQKQQQQTQTAQTQTDSWDIPQPPSSGSGVERAIGAIAWASRSQLLTQEQQDLLVDFAVRENNALLALAWHFPPNEFVRHALRNVDVFSNGAIASTAPKQRGPDCVIVGGGLAGLTAALAVLDRGGNVVLVEKEMFLGGNSARASSGINGVDGTVADDSAELYMQDMLNAAQGQVQQPVLEAMVHGSSHGLQWVRSRLNLALEKKGQLGGHSKARTHRPAQGMAGTELVVAVQRQLRQFEGKSLTFLKGAQATEILLDSSQTRVQGLRLRFKNGTETSILSPSVVIATGGYAADTAPGGLLEQYRPDIKDLPTTNGMFATGDGHKMLVRVGAELIGMDDIQIHPTGFVDPEEENAQVKTLCAEILRGVGGLLLNNNGIRFCNELGNRGYVTSKMNAQPRKTNSSRAEAKIVLNGKAAAEADKHVPMYQKKGLLVQLDTVDDLARWMGVQRSDLITELSKYDSDAAKGEDSFGKRDFHNIPWVDNKGDGTGPFFGGTVTPVVHYTMGGVKIDAKGRVLRATDGSVVEGLFAAGEVTGGIHGKMRLGGNALTECIVFGLAVGNTVPVGVDAAAPNRNVVPTTTTAPKAQLPTISTQELAAHTKENACWVALFDKVYDFYDFLEEHPGGPKSIRSLCGTDGTKEFTEVHTEGMLDDFEPIGLFAA